MYAIVMLSEVKHLDAMHCDQQRDASLRSQSIPSYKPLNPAYRAAALVELNTARNKAQHDEIHAQQALAVAPDAAAAEWTLHNAVLGARTQVLAQFGNDSNEMQAMGLKKRSDRKRPTRTGARTPQNVGK